MPVLRTVHTCDLTPGERESVRALLDAAFAGDPAGEFTETDWSNTLGGMHTLALLGGTLVGHVAVVQRRLLLEGVGLRTGYVEGLAVAAVHRRRRIGSMLMGEAERVIEAAYELGALSDGTEITGFYGRRGWTRWDGPTAVLAPQGVHATPDDDGGIWVRSTPASPDLAPLVAHAQLACDWRPGDVW
jgi:aminoglycoside 2'-N-acetyltransferase I